MKTTDGTGKLLDPTGLYYVQDTRQVVGNCGSWWAPNGSGYECSIDKAGVFLGDYVTSLRDTDVPWPVDYVRARVIHHVRVDNQDFRRQDDDQPPTKTRRRR